jgi:hypothetical protein
VGSGPAVHRPSAGAVGLEDDGRRAVRGAAGDPRAARPQAEVEDDGVADREGLARLDRGGVALDPDLVGADAEEGDLEALAGVAVPPRGEGRERGCGCHPGHATPGGRL